MFLSDLDILHAGTLLNNYFNYFKDRDKYAKMKDRYSSIRG